MVDQMLTALLISALSLAPMPSQQDSIPSVPLTLKTPTGDIAGSLVVRPGTAQHPVVLIIAGSGPTDRDGNSPAPIAPGKTLRTDSYKLLAQALAAEGIASVRYDKRGIGASAKAMAGMRPKTVLLQVAQTLACSLRLSGLAAASNAVHVFAADYSLRRRITADYDSFWAESGGRRVGRLLFALPTTKMPRDLAEYKPNKRAQVRRRQHLERQIVRHVSEAIKPMCRV